MANLSAAITRLAQVGATTFTVPSLPLLGERPLVRRVVAANRGPDIVDVLNRLTSEFDAQWFAATTDLEARLGIRVCRLDVHGLFERVLARPEDFGFADVTGTAKLGEVGAPGSVVPNPHAYLFWDPIHPSAAFHRLVGAAVAARRTVSARRQTPCRTTIALTW